MITQNKRPEEEQKYTGMQGVNGLTAQQLGQVQQQGYQAPQTVTQAQQKAQSYAGGYQPGEQAQQAQQQLQAIQAQKPQGYTSKYGGQLESILNELQGKKFTYDLNGDAFFNSLKDTRMQAAKQASLNAIGQAAGLTGGYGNSYAQAAGNQAYQQSMLSLYDDAKDAYGLALQRFQMEQQGLGDQFNRVAQMENQEYGRYRDTLGDWQNERNYLTNRADTEAERDYQRWATDRDYWTQQAQMEDQKAYQRYANERDYWTGLAQVENQAYQSEAARQEAIRQYEQDFAEQVRQAELNEAYRRDQLIEQQRGTNLDESYRRDTLAEQIRQADLDEAYRQQTFGYTKERDAVEDAFRQQQFDEQVRQFNASLDWDKMSAEQKNAAQYAMAILASGMMPSDEMLQAAGLSAEDAQKMMAQITTGGGSGGRKTYYTDGQGNFYTADGKKVDQSQIKSTDLIDTSKEVELTVNKTTGSTAITDYLKKNADANAQKADFSQYSTGGTSATAQTLKNAPTSDIETILKNMKKK